MDINDFKKEEIQEIIDFYYFIKDYGHIYHDDPFLLHDPFNKILKGIEEVKNLVDDNYSK